MKCEVGKLEVILVGKVLMLMYDGVEEGVIVEVIVLMGDFLLKCDVDMLVVLILGGVGIMLMMLMVLVLIVVGSLCDVWFIYVCCLGVVYVFCDWLNDIVGEYVNVKCMVLYELVGLNDCVGIDYDFEGCFMLECV